MAICVINFKIICIFPLGHLILQDTSSESNLESRNPGHPTFQLCDVRGMEQCTVITDSLHFCSSIEWKHKNIKCTSGYDVNDAAKIKSERKYNKVLMVVELGAPVFFYNLSCVLFRRTHDFDNQPKPNYI